MEEKLFTYEEFQSLIDSSYDGIHITDAQGVTLFYNKACEEIEGIDKADIIGRNVQEFVDSGVYPESITLEAIAQHGEVIGFDLVEVAPQYDPTGMTGQTAARIMLDLLSYVLKEKELDVAKGLEHYQNQS